MLNLGLAADLAGAKGRAFVMRVLAILIVLVLVLGLVPLPAAHAETPADGQALGILVLVGLLKRSPPSADRSPMEKPRPSLHGDPKLQSRAVDVKSRRSPAKDAPARLDQPARVSH
jgi:hypothetical protein